VTNSTDATFSFTATKTGSTFECKLDGAAFSVCASPQSYSALAAGGHAFQVRATDAAGNTDPTPASFAWTIDTAVPDTTISASPSAVTNSPSATFSFTATKAGSTFECKLDGAAFSVCTSPLSYSALAADSHTFQVRATDAVGNTDPTPASFTWVVDTTAPDTTLAATPPTVTNNTSSSFSFAATKAGSSFECKLDGGAFAPCISPQSYSALAAGSHAFQVRATDAAGNTDPTPASFTWTIDTAPPTVTIASPTSAPTYVTSNSLLSLSGAVLDNLGVAQVAWTSSRGGDPTAAVVGPGTWTASGIVLQPGSNVLTVTARDIAGNTATATLTATFIPPDTSPPTVTITSPTSGAPYDATGPLLTLGGFASDNVGVTQVTWTNSRGGSGTASGTTSWAADRILLRLGTNVLAVTASDASGNTATTTLTVTLSLRFTDDPLVPGTPVPALHFTELRSVIDSERVAFGLPAFDWTDPALIPGMTPARAVHLSELRIALNQAYQAAGRPPPTYTDSTVTAEATVIKATQLNELRSAVRALLD